MKYCPFCKRLNSGRPAICNYCGRSWYHRLCSRGHENPHDAQYCGNCGSTDMTETVGRRSLVMPLLSVAGVVMLVLVIKSLVVHLPGLLSSVFGALLCYLVEGIVLLVFLSMLFHILP